MAWRLVLDFFLLLKKPLFKIKGDTYTAFSYEYEGYKNQPKNVNKNKSEWEITNDFFFSAKGLGRREEKMERKY